MDQSQEIESALNRTADDLLADIGQQLLPTSVAPRSREQAIQIAKNWIDKKRSTWAQHICENEKVQEIRKMTQSRERQILLVAAVADVIASIVVGVGPVTAAALLVREGLETLCGSPNPQ